MICWERTYQIGAAVLWLILMVFFVGLGGPGQRLIQHKDYLQCDTNVSFGTVFYQWILPVFFCLFVWAVWNGYLQSCWGLVCGYIEQIREGHDDEYADLDLDDLEALGAGPEEPAIPEQPIHTLVLQRWKANPKLAVLRVENESAPRSAEEMQTAAAKVATALSEGAVGDIVPILASSEEGFEFVAGLMGVLMSGAAFCPIDVTQPADRVTYLMENCQAKVLVVSKSTVAVATNTFSWRQRLVSIDEYGHVENLQSSGRSSPHASKRESVDQGLYVIFTSGSTGKPKGTLLSHRAVLSHLMYYIQKFDLDSEELDQRILRTTAVTFDMCYSQILGALLSGASLVWPATQLMKDPVRMEKVCEDYKVSFLMMVPSALNLFLEVAAFPWSVKNVGSGGEALHHSVASTFFETSGQARLHNRYGPTEAAINTSIKVMKRPPRVGDTKTIPVGRPSAWRHVYICKTSEDDDPDAVKNEFELADYGEQGELLTAGACLADCYLHNEEKTRKAFVENVKITDLEGNVLTLPFDGRAYRTGDVMRWVGAELEFMGRADSQVKLRGLRIELGEIEAQMRAFPGIQEAQVLVRDDLPQGGQRLLAWVSPPSLAGAPELVAHLGKFLAPYMIPEGWVPMEREAWERTTTGKIDRKSLAAMNLENAGLVWGGSGGGGEGAAEPGNVQKLDSLGQVRQLHKQEVDVDVALDNLRAGMIVMIVANHWMSPRDGRYWVPLELAPWREYLGFWFFSNHSLGLALISGLDDSRNINPFSFTLREPTFLFLYYVSQTNFYLWYFPAFVLVKCYTVVCHRLNIRPWVYVLGYTLCYTVLPLFFQLTSPKSGEEINGCILLGDNDSWLSNLTIGVLGYLSLHDPFMVWTIAPFYWMGLFGGPFIITHARDLSVHFTSVKDADWLQTLRVCFSRLLLLFVTVVLTGILLKQQLLNFDPVINQCTTFRTPADNTTSVFVNVVDGYASNVSWTVLQLAIYVAMCTGLLAGSFTHWESIGKTIVGSLFLHGFMPISAVSTGEIPEVSVACVNVLMGPIWWFRHTFPNWFGALLQLTWATFMIVVFCMLFGQIFMAGFVPCAQFAARLWSTVPRSVLVAAIVFWIILQIPAQLHHVVRDIWIEDWGVPHLIAGFLSVLLASGSALCLMGLVIGLGPKFCQRQGRYDSLGRPKDIEAEAMDSGDSDEEE